MGVREKIAFALLSASQKKEYGKGITVSSTGKTFRDSRKSDPELMDFEDLYQTDGLINAAVEMMVAHTTGVGFYTTMEVDEGEDASDQQNKAKDLVDEFCQDVALDEMNQKIFRDMCVYGNAWVEKITPRVLGNVKILPSDRMKLDYVVNKDGTITGKLKGYKQIKSNKPIEDAIPFNLDEIIHYALNPLSSSRLGQSIIKPVYSLVSNLNDFDNTMLKIAKRYAAPKIVWPLPKGAPSELKKFQDYIAKMHPDQDMVVQGWDFKDNKPLALEIDPRGRFENYIDLSQQKVMTGLQTPLLQYLRNATEASANVMMDFFQNKTEMSQRYLKRKQENEIFANIIRADSQFTRELRETLKIKKLTEQELSKSNMIPRLNWGFEKTGVEDIQLSDIALLARFNAVTPFQARELLRKIGVPVEEQKLPDEVELEIPTQKQDLEDIKEEYRKGTKEAIKRIESGKKIS